MHVQYATSYYILITIVSYLQRYNMMLQIMKQRQEFSSRRNLYPVPEWCFCVCVCLISYIALACDVCENYLYDIYFFVFAYIYLFLYDVYTRVFFFQSKKKYFKIFGGHY